MVILRRSIQLNSFSGFCITKLDVLDGFDVVKICTGYRLNGHDVSVFPTESLDLAACEPIYEELPGWQQSTVGVKEFSALPENAQHYLLRIEELAGVPIHLISTGPDRLETIILHHPFEDEARENIACLAGH
jgi:adenylosuccinate synthase